ncbi:mitochondrial Cox1 translational activator Tac1 [Schizosaccharomyces osmophilus]|uniref:Mitochondrial Cox1 translational activator Tac1 n=1 Tax=Schizosaccharomyces osmophilus TaxID=2545709 RepID=A0AAE9W6U3_9SCHI|nr:mitochondrial Cox1 translational activator Tac1 [Schizosaccharomyces osmophilus]WBW70949.1 mitochondrial Cox1 translational activator Tac1 [Schizosaccharomyces osmophilus]
MNLLRNLFSPPRLRTLACYKTFSSSAWAWSGHNKWSKIKHKKTANDQARSKQVGKISQGITMAVRTEGTNPDMNIRLATLLEQARKNSIPKSVIETAMKRGSGGGGADGIIMQALDYEGMHPSGVGFIVETITDNRSRAAANIKHILKKHSASLSNAKFLFSKKGKVEMNPPADRLSMELGNVLDDAIEAGAEDVVQRPKELVDEEDEGQFVILAEPASLNEVAQYFRSKNYEIKDSRMIYVPVSDTAIDLQTNEQAKEQMQNLVDDLYDIEDVMYIHTSAANSHYLPLSS